MADIPKQVADRAASKTYWFGIAVGALGYVQTNFEQVRGLLGEYAGLAYLAIGVTIIALREVTKSPIQGRSDVAKS